MKHTNKPFARLRRALVKRKNRKLLKRYPILRPTFYGMVDEEYDYSYTMLDFVCVGWQPFFLTFCDKVQDHLRAKGIPFDQFHFCDLKEKWGTLRIDCDANDRELFDMALDAENASMLYCPSCGKPTKYVTSGYVLYLCPECFHKAKLEGRLLTSEDIPYWKEYKHEEDGTVTTEIKPSPYEAQFKAQWNGRE